ncbi:hypothetical protein B0H14DRAFT_2621160 [Mycena olivaceomarginata]|nr:hypothetical protein B0H14DRAFT_2621160 [Mycena olivaceomarginata]
MVPAPSAAYVALQWYQSSGDSRLANWRDDWWICAKPKDDVYHLSPPSSALFLIIDSQMFLRIRKGRTFHAPTRLTVLKFAQHAEWHRFDIVGALLSLDHLHEPSVAYPSSRSIFAHGRSLSYLEPRCYYHSLNRLKYGHIYRTWVQRRGCMASAKAVYIQPWAVVRVRPGWILLLFSVQITAISTSSKFPTGFLQPYLIYDVELLFPLVPLLTHALNPKLDSSC